MEVPFGAGGTAWTDNDDAVSCKVNSLSSIHETSMINVQAQAKEEEIYRISPCGAVHFQLVVG